MAIVAENVTDTRTTYLDHHGFRFALLTLENSDHRPVTLGPESLARLRSALEALDTSAVDAVAVTGRGRVFCAGADLKKMTEAADIYQAEEVARRGMETLGRLAALPLPTFAFVNGTALGGGLELALHADYRTGSDSVRAMGFPEVALGLVPGWGGIHRTAALIGAAGTARLVIADALARRHLSAADAAQSGLVDAVLPEEGFLRASLDYAAGILSGDIAPPSRRAAGGREPADLASGRPSALEGIREQLDARFHGATPAPYRALDLISASSSPDQGAAGLQEEEIHAFGELLLTDQARASIYAFRLTQSLAKKSAGEPSAKPLPVRSVGIVGAGLMASQLALLFAQQLRIPVRITDLSPDRIDTAMAWIGEQLRKLEARGRIQPAEAAGILALVSGGTDKTALADCDVVIEAVFEDLGIKRSVFAELEPLLRPEALLLTNTSSLSIEDIGSGLARPGRAIGFHFFNPVAVLPLVEIIASPQTDETTLATAFELARRLRKTAVRVADSPGFVVNRLLARLLGEVFELLDQGADPEAVNHALDPLGLPMRPLELLQFIGPSVQLHICETMNQAYPHRFGVSRSLKALVDAGLPGYLDAQGRISSRAAAFLPRARPTDARAVRGRLLAVLAQEARAMLDESVVTGAEQIDLCMILGANYPFHTGGLTPLLDREVGTSFHPELRQSVPAP